MAAEIMATCGKSLTTDVAVTTSLLGGDWQAKQDRQAFTADERVSGPGAGGTSSKHYWTIHVAPPAPGAG